MAHLEIFLGLGKCHFNTDSFVSGVSVGLECTERTDAECAVVRVESVILLEELEISSVLFVSGLGSPTGVICSLDVLFLTVPHELLE